jgi:60S ribosome subunit biogenesis protein NIP7
MNYFGHGQVWVKPAAEMSLLYGNHVLKSGLGRITESTPSNTGVVLFSMSDVPLGFGVTAKSTAECRSMDPSGIVVLHQADVGKNPVLLVHLTPMLDWERHVNLQVF